MVQLWVNLPAKYKMTPPKYQAIENGQMGKFYLPENKGFLEVIAGEYSGVKGPATTFSPLHMFNGRVKAGARVPFSLPEHYNTCLLVVEGSLRIDGGDPAPTDHFVLFKNDGTDFTVEAQEDAIFLVLSGEPIKEPISAYGPFVMNTREEIVQAYEDLRNGKFGELED